MVRPFVVSPADVHSYTLGRDVAQCMVESLDIEFYGIPVSWQVWTVHLKQEASAVYGIVLLFHGVSHSVKVGLPAAIVPVRMVVDDVPAGALVVGNPARVVRRAEDVPAPGEEIG